MTWAAVFADEICISGVDVVAYVPDGRLRGIVERIGDRLPIRTLTREEECIGFAAGYRCAGGRPLVMMQSSGLGNCLNAVGSLAVPYGIGFPLVVTMRGTLGERNPSQVPMGRATRPLLDAFGIQYYTLMREREITSILPQVFTLAYETGNLSAVLLEPTLEAEDGHR